MASNPTDFSQMVSRATIYVGHVLDVLETIPDESVHCVVTSPPYWGLRDYKLEPQVWGGNSACVPGAWRGSLGLEPTPDLYVQHIVQVFREVRRVLRNDGTLWLNMGDSYSGDKSGGRNDTDKMYPGSPDGLRPGERLNLKTPGFKPKDLIGVPWRVAFALQTDGWWLRSDIIWSKPNPMPESVTDRPTKAHEYLFLLAKAEQYYYDAEAIQEPSVGEWNSITMANRPKIIDNTGRNKRTVWEIPTQPYLEAHFATFPEALVFPCILAGCPTDGTVLDPFVGSGTTLLVAAKNGRNSVGIELQPDYVPLIRRRLAPLEADLVQPLEVVVKSAANAPVDAAFHGAVVAGGPTPILAEPEENQRPPTWPEGQLALFP